MLEKLSYIKWNVVGLYLEELVKKNKSKWWPYVLLEEKPLDTKLNFKAYFLLYKNLDLAEARPFIIKKTPARQDLDLISNTDTCHQPEEQSFKWDNNRSCASNKRWKRKVSVETKPLMKKCRTKNNIKQGQNIIIIRTSKDYE